MTSQGIQADVNDPEGIGSMLRSWSSLLLEVKTRSAQVTDSLNTCMDDMAATERLNSVLETHVDELDSMTNTLDTLLHSCHDSKQASDEELQNITDQKERMESEVEGIQGQEMTISHEDVANEERHIGYVQEDVLTKLEELDSILERIDNSKKELENEWEAWKEDIEAFRAEKEHLNRHVDHSRELILARFIGMHNSSDTDSVSITDRIVQYHEDQIRHRALQHELMQSEIESRDLDIEIGGLMEEKKSLWKRFIDLENCLDGMQEGTGESEGESTVLRPAAAHQDLLHMAGDSPHTSVSEHELTTHLDFENTGKILHRCHKHTNIAIGESLSDENQDAASTQVDTGALDADTERIDSGRKGNDAAPGPPDPDRDQGPDQEPEGGDESTHEQTINKLLDTLQQKGIHQSTIDTIIDATRTIQSQNQEQTQTTTDAAATDEPSSSLMFKMRKRVGGGKGGISSSSQKAKGGRKISATGSMRRLAAAFTRGRRR